MVHQAGAPGRISGHFSRAGSIRFRFAPSAASAGAPAWQAPGAQRMTAAPASPCPAQRSARRCARECPRHSPRYRPSAAPSAPACAAPRPRASAAVPGQLAPVSACSCNSHNGECQVGPFHNATNQNTKHVLNYQSQRICSSLPTFCGVSLQTFTIHAKLRMTSL